jgi:hypothetical protein
MGFICGCLLYIHEEISYPRELNKSIPLQRILASFFTKDQSLLFYSYGESLTFLIFLIDVIPFWFPSVRISFFTAGIIPAITKISS